MSAEQITEQPEPVPPDPQATRRIEWRVTGDPGTHRFGGHEVTFPYYRHVWRDDQNPDAEAEAREFVSRQRDRGNWEDGPHLHSRMVIETPWEPAE